MNEKKNRIRWAFVVRRFVTYIWIVTITFLATLVLTGSIEDSTQRVSFFALFAQVATFVSAFGFILYLFSFDPRSSTGRETADKFTCTECNEGEEIFGIKIRKPFKLGKKDSETITVTGLISESSYIYHYCQCCGGDYKFCRKCSDRANNDKIKAKKR